MNIKTVMSCFMTLLLAACTTVETQEESVEKTIEALEIFNDLFVNQEKNEPGLKEIQFAVEEKAILLQLLSANLSCDWFTIEANFVKPGIEWVGPPFTGPAIYTFSDGTVVNTEIQVYSGAAGLLPQSDGSLLGILANNYVFPNGDILVGQNRAIATPTQTPNVFDVDGRVRFAGGTGQFEQAFGFLRGLGTLTLTPEHPLGEGDIAAVGWRCIPQ